MSHSPQHYPEETGTNPMLEFGPIEDMDPSTANGFRVLYDREVPIEVRGADEEDGRGARFPRTQVGTMELVKVKLLIAGADESPEAFRVELSSEADLFFHYLHEIDDDGFVHIQESQKLMVDFPDYPAVLMRMLNNCIKEPHVHLCIFSVLPAQNPSSSSVKASAHGQENGKISGEEGGSAPLYAAKGRLDFVQNMEYKFVELMHCEFSRSAEEVVQHQITYRYNMLKHKYQGLQGRLQDITTLVKVKNPSLLLHLQKTVLTPTSHSSHSAGERAGGGGTMTVYHGNSGSSNSGNGQLVGLGSNSSGHISVLGGGAGGGGGSVINRR